MTATIKHRFVSAKADGSDNTLVKPSNWNDTHDFEIDSGNLIGRLTAGVGPMEEIPLSAFIAPLLAAANSGALDALGFSFPTTGDLRPTYKTSPAAGWVFLDDGTIGGAASGASNRANADTQALFNLFYNYSDALFPLYTSTGVATTRAAQGTAAVAFSNSCRMSLPLAAGRAFIAAGSGSGLTARTAGSNGGEETHTLLAAELAKHTHGVSVTSSGSANTGYDSNDHSHSFSGATGGMNSANPHSHTYDWRTGFAAQGTLGPSEWTGDQTVSTGATDINHTHNFSGGTSGVSAYHYHSVSISVSGSANTDTGAGVSGNAHNNMQPYTVVNVMVKL